MLVARAVPLSRKLADQRRAHAASAALVLTRRVRAHLIAPAHLPARQPAWDHAVWAAELAPRPNLTHTNPGRDLAFEDRQGETQGVRKDGRATRADSHLPGGRAMTDIERKAVGRISPLPAHLFNLENGVEPTRIQRGREARRPCSRSVATRRSLAASPTLKRCMAPSRPLLHGERGSGSAFECALHGAQPLVLHVGDRGLDCIWQKVAGPVHGRVFAVRDELQHGVVVGGRAPSALQTSRRRDSSSVTIGSPMRRPFANVTQRAPGSSCVSTTKPGTRRVCSAPMSRTASQSFSTAAWIRMVLCRLAMPTFLVVGAAPNLENLALAARGIPERARADTCRARESANEVREVAKAHRISRAGD